MAVIRPLVVMRAAWLRPCEPKLDWPLATSHATYAAATGASTSVSTVRLSTGPTLACFLASP